MWQEVPMGVKLKALFQGVSGHYRKTAENDLKRPKALINTIFIFSNSRLKGNIPKLITRG